MKLREGLLFIDSSSDQAEWGSLELTPPSVTSHGEISQKNIVMKNLEPYSTEYLVRSIAPYPVLANGWLISSSARNYRARKGRGGGGAAQELVPLQVQQTSNLELWPVASCGSSVQH